MAISITTTSTNPLAGTSSFLIQKTGGVNDQGKGVSTEFSVDLAYRAKVLNISFDYIVNSGTFTAGSNSTDSDLIVYLYDITNSRLIEPSSFKLLSNSNTVSDTFKASFQTSYNASQYRLIFHQATTTINNYELKVDNVSVSPTNLAFGTPITDWQNFTPGNSTLTTNTVNTAVRRRVGDNAEVRLLTTFSGTNTQGAFIWNVSTMLGGQTVDINKIPTTTTGTKYYSVGTWQAQDTGVNSSYSGVVVYRADSGNIELKYFATGPEEFNTSVNKPFTIGATDTVSIEFSVPILGWSSSVQMSDSADTRVVAASSSPNTAGGATITTGGANVPFTAASITDTHGAWSTSTNQYTVPSSGWYEVNATIEGQKSNFVANDYVLISVLLGVSGRGSGITRAESTQARLVTSVNTKFFANQGQVISIIGLTNTTGVTYTANDSGCFFGISRISGPQAIAATETIACSFYTIAGQSITSTASQIVFGTKNIDTHGAFNSSTGTFTAPAAGLYQVNVNLTTALVSIPTTGTFQVSIRKNGISEANMGVVGSGSSVNYFVTANTSLYLLSGDTITIFSSSDTSTSLNTAGKAFNTVSIYRIGL